VRSGWPPSSTTIVWLLLLLASGLSYWLGAQAPTATERIHTAAMVGVLVIAFAKIWLIIRYFMEVRFGPRWLRLLLDIWVLAVLAAVTILYLVAPAPVAPHAARVSAVLETDGPPTRSNGSTALAAAPDADQRANRCRETT
jgi:Prokaryotic Cytochrome C oxidase subunit IV